MSDDDAREDRRERARKAVARPLGVRLAIYLLIAVVLTAVVAVDVVVLGPRSVLPAVAGLVAGLAVGLLASRMFAVRWDEVSGSVVAKLDALGAVVLVGYLLFALNRSRLADAVFDGSLAGVASLAALDGVMSGQLLGTRRGVVRALRSSGLFGPVPDSG
jgi:ABC-type transport system involved in cytochrome c biogenesis permease subunit